MKLSLFLLLACTGVEAQMYYATTVAGKNHGLNGVPATSAPLDAPSALAFDTAGNLYIADQGANMVRTVTPDGLIHTLAGTGIADFAAPVSGPALSTQVPGPAALAIDANGNVYIAEQNLVVRVDAVTGLMRVYAGIANCSPCDPALDGGPATQQYIFPLALATDTAGNLFISTQDSTIRKVDSKGNMTIVAGTGTAGSGIDGPARASPMFPVLALATDSSGNLFAAESLTGRIRTLSTTGIFTTIAGTQFGEPGDHVPDNTPALGVHINPVGLAYLEGSLYVADGHIKNTILKLNLSKAIFTNLPFTPPPLPAHYTYLDSTGLPGPVSVAVDNSGRVFVINRQYPAVLEIQDAATTVYAGATDLGDNGPASAALLRFPIGVAAVGSKIYVADAANGDLRRIGDDLQISSVDGTHLPFLLAVDGHGDLFVDNEGEWVGKLASNNTAPVNIAGTSLPGYTGDGGPASSALLNIQGLASDTAGNLYINGGGRIRFIDAASGIISTIAGDGNTAIDADINDGAIAVDAHANIFLAVYSGRIKKIAPNGTVSTIAGAGALGTSGFAGDGGPASQAVLSGPEGIAVDKSGNVFFSDGGNSRIREITTDGIIRTIAGTGKPGPLTSDGPALQTNLAPKELTVDDFGNVYVSDVGNSRILRLSPLIAGATLVPAGGDGQSGYLGVQLATPVGVKVMDSTGAGIAGVPITFTSSPENGATFGPAWLLTGADGTASAKVTLGNSAGALSLTATAPGLPPVEFSATSKPLLAPSVSSNGIIGAGLSVPSVHAVSPGGIVSVFGDQFTDPGVAQSVGPADLVNGAIPENLAHVCVEVNQKRAPIFFVSRTQVNFQMPQVSGAIAVFVQVIADCGGPAERITALSSVALQSASPEFFYFQNNADGTNPVAAVNPITGDYIGPAGAIPGLQLKPAHPDDIVTIYATGFGDTNPLIPIGVLPNGPASATGSAAVSIGGKQLDASDVLYAGASSGAGLYQLNIRVPAGIPHGNQPMVITINGYSSPLGAFLAIGE